MPGPSSAAAGPTRCTLWRRKKQQEKDRAVLSQPDPLGWGKAGDPCDECGLARTALNGHALYKGQFYCKDGDMDKRGPKKWLEERGAFARDDRPRTTAWRKKKAGAAGADDSPRKAFTCQLCGQPKTLDYGHCGRSFCAMYSYKSVERWQAEQRRGDV